MESSWIGLGIASVGVIYGYGRVVQQMNDDRANNAAKFNQTEKMIERVNTETTRAIEGIQEAVKEHSKADFDHMMNNDAHWNTNDRFWLKRELDGIKEWLAKQDEMLKLIITRKNE